MTDLSASPADMARSAAARPPLPLSVWPLAVFFAAVFSCLGYAYFQADTPRSEAFDLHNASRVDALAARIDAGSVGVVLIGDSRLRYAVPSDADFSERLSDGRGATVDVVRLVNNWATWDDFTGLGPRILAARPDLIVLQEGLFAKERETAGRLLHGRAYLTWRLAGRGPWNPGNLDQSALQDERRCEVLNEEDAHQRKRRVSNWVSFDPEGRNARGIAAFIRDAEAAGIEVAVLSIPITASGREVLPGYRRPVDRKTIDPGIALSDSHFCDVVHMNAAGRQRFTDALVGPLLTRLGAGR